MVAGQCYFVFRCRITNDRTTAPCCCTVRILCRRFLELIGTIGDPVASRVLLDDGFRLVSRSSHIRRIVNINTVRVLDQSAAADRCIFHMKLIEAFNLCFARIRQHEQGVARIHMGIEVEVDRLEVLDVIGYGICIDIERVVRHLAGIGGVLAAVNRAIDRVACRHGALAVAEVDGIARHFSRAAGIATVDPVQDAALDGDDVAFHIAVSIAIATVDISCACDDAAFDEHFVLEHVTVRLIACHAAVDTSMHVAALERRRVFLDGSCAAISRHTADQVAIEMIAVECGMIVLDIAAAICTAAEYPVRD